MRALQLLLKQTHSLTPVTLSTLLAATSVGAKNGFPFICIMPLNLLIVLHFAFVMGFSMLTKCFGMENVYSLHRLGRRLMRIILMNVWALCVCCVNVSSLILFAQFVYVRARHFNLFQLKPHPPSALLKELIHVTASLRSDVHTLWFEMRNQCWVLDSKMFGLVRFAIARLAISSLIIICECFSFLFAGIRRFKCSIDVQKCDYSSKKKLG